MTTRIGVFGLASRQEHTRATLSLGAGLALAGHASLVVDLSGEGGLTEDIGLPASASGALTAILTGSAPKEDLGLLVRTIDVGLDLVPGCRALEATASVSVEAVEGALEGVSSLYGTILLHCPGRARALVNAVGAVTTRSVVFLGEADDEAQTLERRRYWLQSQPPEARGVVDFMVGGSRFPRGIDETAEERWHLVPRGAADAEGPRRAFENEWVTRPEAWVFGNLARELLQGE